MIRGCHQSQDGQTHLYEDVWRRAGRRHGGKFYQQVVLFEDKARFDAFVNKGWEATSEVGAVAGKESAELTAKYNGGMAIYQIGEKGLLLDANISGSKYWLDDDLNK